MKKAAVPYRGGVIAYDYRWTCGKRRGRWYATRGEAGDAAVNAGLASWSDGKLFTSPFVTIEQRARPA